MSKGNITLYLLVIIVAIGAFLMVGGFAGFTPSPPTGGDVGEAVDEPPGDKKDSLQLKTIKFRKCATVAAVDFLVDTSGSMSFGTKLSDIKRALYSFSGNFGKDSVTGIRRFSSNDENRCYSSATSRLVPIDFYSNNASDFNRAVGGLCPSSATNTRTAFEAEKNDLEAAAANEKFKDKSFNLVFVTDGIPESTESDKLGACTGAEAYPVCSTRSSGIYTICRCFDTNQDPTSNPHIADQIKQIKSLNGKEIRIFSVLVFDEESDGPFREQADRMMSAIASTPEDYYKTTDSSTLTKIYNEIAQKICEETK